MAENELLDVSNPFIYKRWRKLLAAGSVNPSEAADALYDDFSAALRTAMRKEPLSRIFVACGQDRAALQAAVATCKDRSLAKLVEHACKIEQSGDPGAVARILADLLIDGLTDQCNRQSLGILASLTRDGQSAMESATVGRLEAARPDIVAWLGAALQGNISEVPRPVRVRPPSAEELLNTSLVLLPGLARRRVPHA